VAPPPPSGRSRVPGSWLSSWREAHAYTCAPQSRRRLQLTEVPARARASPRPMCCRRRARPDGK
jgi:hypothetical protein